MNYRGMFVAAFFFFVGSSANAGYLESIRQAETAEENHNNAGAEKLFQQALQEAGSSNISGGYAADSAGKFYTRIGRYQDAEKYLKQAINSARQEVASTVARRKRMEADLAKPISPPNNPISGILMEQVRESQKRSLQSELKSETRHPYGDEPEYTSNLAMCYDLQGRHADADALWASALKMEPELRTSLEELADTTNWKLRQPEKSIALYKRALVIRRSAVTPMNLQLASIYHYVGNTYLSIGKYKDAEISFKTSLDLFKNLPVNDYLSAWAKRSTMDDYVRLLTKTNRASEAAAYTAPIAALKLQEEQFKRH